SRHPLFQVMLVVEHAPAERLGARAASPGLSNLAIPDETSKFDLLLSAIEIEDRLSCLINYNSDLFEAQTIERLIEHFKALIKSLVADRLARLSGLELLLPEERRQILVEWNRTGVAFAQNGSVHQLFEAQAARRPESVAVVFGDEQVSYGELDCRTNRLANYLQAGGGGVESRGGVWGERSVGMVEAGVGVVKAGADSGPL